MFETLECHRFCMRPFSPTCLKIYYSTSFSVLYMWLTNTEFSLFFGFAHSTTGLFRVENLKDVCLSSKGKSICISLGRCTTMSTESPSCSNWSFFSSPLMYSTLEENIYERRIIVVIWQRLACSHVIQFKSFITVRQTRLTTARLSCCCLGRTCYCRIRCQWQGINHR